MADAPLLDDTGKVLDTISLDPDIFGIEPNAAVMHQVVTAQLAAARSGTHSTKTRAEVRGGGRKPWRQKGMGRARHGSTRSPQWTGGGVAHGPKPRDYSQRTPRKMKQLALRSALSARAGAERVKVVDAFSWDAPRTKLANALIDAAGIEGKVLLVVRPEDQVAARSFRNLTHARVNPVGQLNTYDVVWSDTVVFSREALEALGGPAAAGEDDAS